SGEDRAAQVRGDEERAQGKQDVGDLGSGQAHGNSECCHTQAPLPSADGYGVLESARACAHDFRGAPTAAPNNRRRGGVVFKMLLFMLAIFLIATVPAT